MASVFETLNAVNVNGHTEKKNNLTYLSWAWAWCEVKKAYPDATYKVYETPEGCIYWTDGRTCWVKTGVTINGLENIEYLPIMDFRNNSIPVDKVTSMDVNKAIQRSLTKCCARHGLGLYIYAGEDLPEGEAQQGEDLPEGEAQQGEDLPEGEAQQEEDHSNEMCGSAELAVLEAMTKKVFKVEDASKVFKNWPKVTKGQYVTAMEEIKKRTGKAEK